MAEIVYYVQNIKELQCILHNFIQIGKVVKYNHLVYYCIVN